MPRKRKNITRQEFVDFCNELTRKNAETYGNPNRPLRPDTVDYDDFTCSRVLMNVFNDYRGFKIVTIENGATYAHYF